MSKLTEQVQWEEDIYQIQRKDEVSGGRDGIANIQAGQLANRTQFLKGLVESLSDAENLTFVKTDADPDGTIAGMAGSKPGQFFRVAQGIDNPTSFIYYWNAGDIAEPAATYPSAQALLQIMAKMVWEDDILNAFLWEDTSGHSAVRIKRTGEFQAAFSRLFKAVLDDVDIRRLHLMADTDGIIFRIRDKKGRDCLLVTKEGRVLFRPNLKVFNGNALVSDSVGSIKLGDGLVATKTKTGVKISATGAGGSGGPLGKLASQYIGGKLNDPRGWNDRTLVLTAAQAGSPSVFGFWIISTERIANPINNAKLYAYWSTDHGSAGGIFMATADDPMGPWVSQGRIYLDPSSEQTETPAVRWCEFRQHFVMYYHVQSAKYGPNDSISAKGIQSTLCAYSDDAVNWTKDPNFILDKWNQNVGDGHSGYFYPCDTPDGLIARSALGGTGYGLTTIWRHRGGPLGGININGHITNNWYCDYRDVGSNYEATFGTQYQGLRTIPFGLFGFTVNGMRMAVGQLWNRRSATEAATVSIVAGPVTADYKRFIGLPTVIWTPQESWESMDVRMSNYYVDDKYVYVFLSMGVNVASGAGANIIGGFRHAI